MGNGMNRIIGGNIEDKYFLQKVKLGQGSFGVVLRAVDKQNGNVVAVKKMVKRCTIPGSRPEDIEREVTTMKACDHENIIRLFDIYEDSRHVFLALEYCDGGDFGDKIKERGCNLKESEAAEWMRQMLAAIMSMHQKNICHRDIKPDNFMLKSDPTSPGSFVLKLSDFGLAIAMPRGKLLTEQCGTPAFRPPEIHNLPRGEGYGFPADIWAAGCSMYMLMCGGRHPFLSSAGALRLNEPSLLAGHLDFGDGVTGGLFGALSGQQSSYTRFSDAARQLCKLMVCEDQTKRISAQEALRNPWLPQVREPHMQGGSGFALNNSGPSNAKHVQAHVQAEAQAQAVGKARKEIEEKDHKEAEVKAQQTERALKEAEEKAQKAERRAQQAEKALKEAEKKAGKEAEEKVWNPGLEGIKEGMLGALSTPRQKAEQLILQGTEAQTQILLALGFKAPTPRQSYVQAHSPPQGPDAYGRKRPPCHEQNQPQQRQDGSEIPTNEFSSGRMVRRLRRMDGSWSMMPPTTPS
eukprot:gnl/TRDRNA2_/TRDRNA2_179494_c0_seq1.p1 gnl/TRDRNA2_/TRDRNA2_179494_c0~~gnl/TRDRNA2_/TRDRNA2_179494_c0_seq1.p1  ORF type:complete len:520 (+),score=117.80 gnl/TRDRNA2_/TRDRNA2_179494_c0_seq1:51-1610(+)